MKKSSSQWCKHFAIKLGEDIIDPDGWDRSWDKFDASWEEKITLDEFKQRLMFSTIRVSHRQYNKMLIGTLVI